MDDTKVEELLSKYSEVIDLLQRSYSSLEYEYDYFDHHHSVMDDIKKFCDREDIFLG